MAKVTESGRQRRTGKDKPGRRTPTYPDSLKESQSSPTPRHTQEPRRSIYKYCSLENRSLEPGFSLLDKGVINMDGARLDQSLGFGLRISVHSQGHTHMHTHPPP